MNCGDRDNSLGVGYVMYRNEARDGFLTSIAPTLELHVLTPLRTTDPNINLFGVTDSLKLYNTVDFTLGTTFEFAHHTTLGIGVVAPVTGPKPFDVEAIAQLNYRF